MKKKVYSQPCVEALQLFTNACILAGSDQTISFGGGNANEYTAD